MKKHLLRVVCLLLLAGLWLPPQPAAAGTAAWSAEPMPGLADSVLGPAGVDIRDMAVAAGGSTIYLAPGDSLAESVIYKSADAGSSWAGIGAGIQADLVAVAPDDAAFVAIASSAAPEVYISADGGATWQGLGAPRAAGGAAAVLVSDIAVSPQSGGAHYVAVAGEEAGGAASVWYYPAGAISPSWQETRSLAGFSGADKVGAVAFSPAFSSDSVMLAVSQRDGLSVDLQILSFASEKWNAPAGFSGYPVEIAASSGISGLAAAALSLAPGYLGSDAARRTAFVGLAVTGAPAASGIYRLDDTAKKALQTGTAIRSLDFNGSKLVAGAYDSNEVFRSTSPQASAPSVAGALALKRPGGQSKTMVAWAGGSVVAGTSGDESAFAVSVDSGAAFVDIAFIDTVLAYARDVAVSPGGGKVYLVTDDGADLSLWRRTSSWERVLSLPGASGYIVRLAPDDANAVYLAGKGTQSIYRSSDGGSREWFGRSSNIEIQDMAVESSDTAYILSAAGKVSRSADGGFTWGAAVSAGIDDGTGHTIISAGSNNLLVGSTNGYAAYSLDGNFSWTRVLRVLQAGAGKVQMIAGAGFTTDRTIYAASDKPGQNIKKWVIGSSTDWTDIFAGTLAGGIYGLAVDSGVLYALELRPGNQSALWICLEPAFATASSSSWSSRATGASTDADDTTVQLNAAPRALKSSSVGKLWAVKTNGTSKLYSFDAVLTALKLKMPAAGAAFSVNAVSGLADEIVFSWEQTGGAAGYQLDIAYDRDFKGIVSTIAIDSTAATIAVTVGPRQEGSARVSLTPGSSYYWRVRVTQPLYGLYSEVRAFTVAPVAALSPRLLTPPNGGSGVSRTPSFSWEPVSGASGYRFVLADNVALSSPIVDADVRSPGFAMPVELEYGRTYYWAISPLNPLPGNWSALANFTVRAEPAGPSPPLVVRQLPPPVIDLPPQPSPPDLVFAPPGPPPEAATPAYIWALIIGGSALALAVALLVLGTFRLPAFAGGDKLRAALLAPLRMVSPGRAAPGGGVRERHDARRMLLAAEGFGWMTDAAKGNVLSAAEERELGQIVAAKIRGVAAESLLYRDFPGEAPLLLSLWARYGSREETASYLSCSFRSKDNVVSFLRCYRGEGGFSRAQYDAVAAVVDPESVLAALRKRFGKGLEAEPAEEGPPDEALARQFARVHRQASPGAG